MPTNTAEIVKATPGLTELTDRQVETFSVLLELLLRENQRVNLTAIKDRAAVALHHFADSLVLLQAAPNLAKVACAADVGAGAGFPVLPLAIMKSEIQWLAIESVGKKSDFIKLAARELGLTNVQVYAGRAEEAARTDFRESFDLVTARAVGAEASLLEVCLPLLKIGGAMCLFKTEAALQSWREAGAVAQQLGAASMPHHTYRLPGDNQDRLILRAEKVASTPEKYPRPAGAPFKKPLKSRA